MLTWTDEGGMGEQSCEACFGTIGYEGDGRWWWDVTIIEGYVSGGYPGTPDWREYPIGCGFAPSEAEAKWRCLRAYDRAMIRERVNDDEMTRLMDEMEAAQAAWEAEGWEQ